MGTGRTADTGAHLPPSWLLLFSLSVVWGTCRVDRTGMLAEHLRMSTLGLRLTPASGLGVLPPTYTQLAFRYMLS